jgi:hypothetical protein
MDSDTRAILADVRTERTTVNELDRTLTSGYLKARLKEASDLLDDVEGWLATPIERRKATDVMRWRDFVDGVLDMAERRRQHVQELVKRFGPDVQTP